MKLSIEQIKKIACGVAKVEENNGYFRLNRFTDEQINFYKDYKEGFFYSKALCSAGVRLVFNTDSESLFIKGITSSGTNRTYYSFDILVNDEFVGCIDNFLQETSENYIGQNFNLGKFEKEFNLGQGIKKVEVFLPFSVVVDFEEISLDDGAFISPIKRKNTGLIFGDSITQGYDNAHVSKHYSISVSKLLDVDFINKAIGGEKFNPLLAKTKDNIQPDYIVVAYGTNDWGQCSPPEEFCDNCKEFYYTLRKNYPDSKIIALSPLWRKEIITEKKSFDFDFIEKTIFNVVSELDNVVFISGFDLVPHEEKNFADFRLHPNDLGFSFFADNLCKKIQDSIEI